MKKHVYLVFSSTPYKIGKIIRRLTGELYNHVSIALDAELSQMYGFARRYYRTPLYGGFVKESRSRYHVNGTTAQVRICQIQVTQAQYDALEERLERMHQKQAHYLYNHLSIFTTPFGRLVKIKDCYICVEFVVEILHALGYPLDPNRYYSVGTLEQLMTDKVIYTGPMPQGDSVDTEYFAPHPVPPFTSLRAFGQLLARLRP